MQKSFLVLFAIVSVVALHAKAETTPKVQADDLVVISPEGAPPEDVIAFWTSERMTEAWEARGSTPIPLPPIDSPLDKDADGSGYTLVPAPYAEHEFSRITGILFIREKDPTGDVLKHCSASVIRSKSESIILTAAHCFLYAPFSGPNWFDMLMFVPAYRENADGTKDIPLGKWPVQRAFIPAAYIPKDGDEVLSADIGVARVYPEVPSSGLGLRTTLEQTVGDAFIPEVSLLPGRFPLVKVIGYPSVSPYLEPPYALGEQRQCDSFTEASSEDQGNIVLLNCSPQSGNSGGPLVDMTRPEARRVLGVFAKTIPLYGQPTLQPQTFFPIFSAADSEVLP